MITGKRKEDRMDIVNMSTHSHLSYRELPFLNVSSIKIFKESGPQAFFQQVIMKRPSKKRQELDESDAIIIGSVLDFILTDCDGNLDTFEQKYDERFVLYDGVKSKTQEFLLADELFRLMKEYSNESGELTEGFMVIFEEALDNMKAKEKFKGKTVEKALELFQAKPTEEKLRANPNLTSAYEYFQVKMESIDKQTVDMWHLETAKRLHEQSQTDIFVQSIFFPTGEVKDKMVIQWTYESEYGPIQCKSELDKAIFDHDEKKVWIIDIKTIYDNRRDHIRRRYKKLLYGWQAQFYVLAMRYWLDENGMDDYTIEFSFAFFATGSNLRPVVLDMTDILFNHALFGYNDGFEWVVGLQETLECIAFAEYNDVYNMDRDIYLNGGRVAI